MNELNELPKCGFLSLQWLSCVGHIKKSGCWTDPKVDNEQVLWKGIESRASHFI